LQLSGSFSFFFLPPTPKKKTKKKKHQQNGTFPLFFFLTGFFLVACFLIQVFHNVFTKEKRSLGGTFNTAFLSPPPSAALFFYITFFCGRGYSVCPQTPPQHPTPPPPPPPTPMDALSVGLPYCDVRNWTGRLSFQKACFLFMPPWMDATCPFQTNLAEHFPSPFLA